MKKRLLMLLLVIAGLSVSKSIAKVCDDLIEVDLQVGILHPYGSGNPLPKSPINPPSASLDDHTFYINGEHSGYTLYLIDNSGDEPDVVYQVVIPAGVNAVVLPATLAGIYELQLHNGGAFYFYAEIILS